MRPIATIFVIGAVAHSAAAFAVGNDPANRFARRHNLASPIVHPEDPARQVKPFGSQPDENHPALKSLMAMRSGSAKDGERDELKLQAIYEAAQTAGVHAGMDARMAVIRDMLEGNAHYLDWAYNFAMLLQDGQMMPPVIVRGTRGMRIVDDSTLTTARVIYTLESDARVVSEPPSWRDFLLRDFGPAPRVPDGLLPSNKDEVERWQAGLSEGWAIGYQHADALHDAQVALLTRTYQGMQTSLELVMQGRLQPAMLASAERGITLDETGRNLVIDDRVYRITAPAAFSDPDEWLVIPQPIDGSRP